MMPSEPLAARLGQAARRAAWCATFVVGIDLALAFSDAKAPAWAQLPGWLAGLGLGFVVLVLPWLLYAALPTPSADTPSPARRLRHFFVAREGTADDAARSGALLGALLTFALSLGAAFAIGRTLIIDIARPHFAALAVLGAQLALAVLGLALFPRFAALGAGFTRAIARTPLAAVTGHPLRLAIALGVLGVGGAASAAYTFWSTLSFLPWRTVGCVAGALAATFVLERLLAHAARSLRFALSGVLAVVIAFALVAVAGLDQLGAAPRRGFLASLVGRSSRSAALAVFDFDRDGYLGMLGDGDCDPFDARISPAAVEIPDNGRDEDCDGEDLKRGTLIARPRQHFPIPATIEKKPPIVLITIDAFAARHMSALGSERPTTPALDAFAAKGTLFRSCFAHGPSTRLSFPSIFTSRWDGQIKQKLVGKHPFPIDASEVMLAEVVHDAGYDTTAIVSDEYFSPKRWSSLMQGFTHIVDSPIQAGRGGKHNGSVVTDAAITALDRERGDKPAFLWVHYYDAHSPHKQPKDVTSYGTKTQDLYDAELILVDREVGRLLAAIEERFGDGAFVFITGDHGIAFDPPRHAKLNYGYDLSTAVLHVPLIVRGPSVRAQQLDGVVSTMDVAPTVTNLLRVQRKLPFQGASLAPELFEGETTRPAYLHHQFFIEERLWDDKAPLEIASVRTDRYNLIHDLRSGLFELYDYRADYWETRDLSGSPAKAAELEDLKRRLALFVYDFGSQRGSSRARPARATKPARRALKATGSAPRVGAPTPEGTSL